MTKKNSAYFVFVILITNLHFQEYWGLNALISATIFVVYLIVTQPKINGKSFALNPKWWLAAALFLANGFAIFSTGHLASNFYYFVSLFYFTTVHHDIKISFPFAMLQSISSFAEGLYEYALAIGARFEKKEDSDTRKKMVRILVYLVPICIAIIFLKLYQTADEQFYEWTKFINLDWISWPFILLALLFSILLYGFAFFKKNAKLTEVENTLRQEISVTHTDRLERFMGVETETKIATSLLLLLNLMLVVYLAIDFQHLIFDLPQPKPTFRYSEFLHAGVNSLIASILLVILLTLLIFRGQLNFIQKKNIRIAGQIWLLLNIIMVCTTVLKNYEYIAHWGLTYKRIGVYVYLLLAALGLALTLVKIRKNQTAWVLIRNSMFAFFICLTLNGQFNWDRIIVNYNLNHIELSRIDYDYLINLGSETYPDLVAYQTKQRQAGIIFLTETQENYLIECAKNKLAQLVSKKETSSWRSLTYYDKNLLERLNAALNDHSKLKK